MSASDCMPVGLTYDNGLKGCASSNHLLFSLAAFNVWSAFLSLILGHEVVRRRLPSLSKGDRWKPYTAVLTTLIHPITMLAATLAIRVNGFYPNIFFVFAVWTMRPRMVAAPVLYLLSMPFSKAARKGRNPYLWTFKDNLVEESLLNAFSLPFALFFVLVRNDNENGWCAEDSNYIRFWDSFYVMTGVGVLSLFILLMLCIYACMRKTKQYTRVGGSKGHGVSVNKFWGWALWLGALNMVVAFAGQWLLWGTFIYNAGTDFCPGSLVGESIAWAVALFVIAIARPLVGGPN